MTGRKCPCAIAPPRERPESDRGIQTERHNFLCHHTPTPASVSRKCCACPSSEECACLASARGPRATSWTSKGRHPPNSGTKISSVPLEAVRVRLQIVKEHERREPAPGANCNKGLPKSQPA